MIIIWLVKSQQGKGNAMPLDKSVLIDFLEVLDGELEKGITLVAVGGTAMTLLDLKKSTIDVDFTIPSEDEPLFSRALSKIAHGFKIDYWTDGLVFCTILPDDYLENSVAIARLRYILLKALHPVDIIVTKIGRLDDRDLEDIEECIEKYNISKEQIAERAATVQYVGNEKLYEYNLHYILEQFYKTE